MSQENVEVVRAIFKAWEQGDFGSAAWAEPEIEFGIADGVDAGSWTGRARMAAAWRAFLSAWKDLRSEAEDYRELDNERVLVLNHFSGRGKTSGLDVDRSLSLRGACLFHVRDEKVTKLVLWGERARALADLGLSDQDAHADS